MTNDDNNNKKRLKKENNLTKLKMFYLCNRCKTALQGEVIPRLQS